MIQKVIYTLLILSFTGCGSKVVTTQEPSLISNIKIEANENCDIERK